MQPPSFKGKGDNTEKDTEAWIESMDDYFTIAKTAQANCSMLGMFRLTSEPKLWWKQYYHDKGVAHESQSWNDIKQAVRGRYWPPAHQSQKMNEFFTLNQNELTLEKYYSKFVTLGRYGPILTTEQQVAWFCQGLKAPLDAQLEAMQPTSLQNVLLSAKTLSKKKRF
ncbi:hypothetical protein L7F22_062372 [Adiantum nelumboides]|nr:hypothetical protein [Adiantum nelumboides]